MVLPRINLFAREGEREREREGKERGERERKERERKRSKEVYSSYHENRDREGVRLISGRI